MELITEFFKEQRTYLEYGTRRVKLVQTKGGEVVFERSFDELSADLNFYLAELAFQPDRITLLIPSPKLFLRSLDLPREAEQRLDEMVDFQFVNQLPCSGEEVYASYYKADKQEGRIKVLAYAVLKDYLDHLLNLCEAVELEVDAIIPVPVVFYLLHTKNELSTNTLYIDNCLDYFNFTFIGSEEIYLRTALRKDTQETKAYLNSQADRGVEEIKESIRREDFWLEIEEAVKLLAGGGLVDLESQVRTEEVKRIKWTAALLALLLVFNFMLQWQLKEMRRDDLTEKLERVEPVVGEIKEMEQEIMESRAQVADFKAEIDWQDNYLPWLIELNTILESSVEIKELNFSAGKLALLAGKAPRAGAVMDKLEESSYFKNLNFRGAIETVERGERFKIEGDLDDGFN